MTAHIVLAHPEARSFNGHLAAKSAEILGPDHTMSDLYGMGFDPCEGPQHFSVRRDADVFHTQTEQRFSADQGATPMSPKRPRACSPVICW